MKNINNEFNWKVTDNIYRTTSLPIMDDPTVQGMSIDLSMLFTRIINNIETSIGINNI